MEKLISLRIDSETWRKIKAGAALKGLTIGRYLALLLDGRDDE